MSRDQGFNNADVDVGKHSDPKVRTLWRHLRDENAMNSAMVLHEAVVLASWAAGERITAEDAAPPWMTDVEAPTQALAHVGLLDDRGFLPLRSWRSWFAPAAERRQANRERWNRNKAEQRAVSVDVRADSARSHAPPPVPPVPPVPTVPPATAREAAAAYQRLYGREPSGSATTWLDELSDKHGAKATVAALTDEHGQDPDRKTILGRTRDRLGSGASEVEQHDREQRQHQAITELPGYAGHAEYYANGNGSEANGNGSAPGPALPALPSLPSLKKIMEMGDKATEAEA
jgi:hypothetical protein